MAKQTINDFDFELWAEQEPNLSQDLGVRPPKTVSRFAQELAEKDGWVNWNTLTRELSGPVRKVPVEEYLRQKR